MRIFAISDLHIDYEENRLWLKNLSKYDYKKDILILAGDISDRMHLIRYAFETLKSCFKEVLFVPGNHDLWVVREDYHKDSFEKFHAVQHLAKQTGIVTKTFTIASTAIVPLTAWYDYSFANITEHLKEIWSDFSACIWKDNFHESDITKYFLDMNEIQSIANKYTQIISYSHFLPRIDIMPEFIPYSKRDIYGLLGCNDLGKQVKELGSSIHIYGHSHVNNQVKKDGTLYINNAYGYPREVRITRKELRCIFEL